MFATVLQSRSVLYERSPSLPEIPISTLSLSIHTPASTALFLLVADRCHVPVPCPFCAVRWCRLHNRTFPFDGDVRISPFEVSGYTVPVRRATAGYDYPQSALSLLALPLLSLLPHEVVASIPPACRQSPHSEHLSVLAGYSQKYGNQLPVSQTTIGTYSIHPHKLLSVPISYSGLAPVPESVILRKIPVWWFLQSASARNADVSHVSFWANRLLYLYP